MMSEYTSLSSSQIVELKLRNLLSIFPHLIERMSCQVHFLSVLSPYLVINCVDTPFSNLFRKH